MSTCSLQQILEKSLPENSNLSWIPMKHSPSFTEIFRELHFSESPILSPSSPHVVSSSPSSPLSDNNTITTNSNPSPPITPKDHSFSPLSLERLKICIDQSHDFKSSDEVDHELKIEEELKDSSFVEKNLWKSNRSSSTRERQYPPPISCMRSGRPCVSFKCYRSNGRFVLKEIRIPTQDFLHASRKDGRLKLHFVQEEEEDFPEESDQEEEDSLESRDEGEESHDSVTDQEESKENRD